MERLPAVADIEGALMSELRLTLDEGETSHKRIGKAVRGISFCISPKGAKAERPKDGITMPQDAVIGGTMTAPQLISPICPRKFPRPRTAGYPTHLPNQLPWTQPLRRGLP